MYHKISFIKFTIFLLAGFYSSTITALEVNIAKKLPSIQVMHNGVPVTIQRIQDKGNHLTGGFTKTSRKCPPFCIQPIHPAPGVTTVGELEMLNFMQTKLQSGQGIVIDARTPDWYKKGTIPGSVNIPFTTFTHSEYHPKLREAMKILGVKLKQNGNGVWNDLMVNIGLADSASNSPWDFSDAKDILLWCNGMWCGQSPTAIRNLLKIKYPVEKIYYYRGGMQSWQILGLTVFIPES